MKRMFSMVFAGLCLAALAGCSQEVKTLSDLKIELTGDPGTRARGFWVSTKDETNAEATHEIMTYVPETITATVPGLKHFSIRKIGGETPWSRHHDRQPGRLREEDREDERGRDLQHRGPRK